MLILHNSPVHDHSKYQLMRKMSIVLQLSLERCQPISGTHLLGNERALLAAQ